MYDEPDVRSVDAHAESDGGHHDLDALVEESILVRLAILIGEPRVIGQRRHADLTEPGCQRVNFPPRRAVDDAGFAAMAIEEVEQLAFEGGARKHAVKQV